MSNLIRGLSLAAGVLSVAACAPPGQGQLGYRDIDWPRADHFMTPSENREIEILLGRLGYMQSGADGTITTDTRSAIRTYQRDIGAPITGYVSTPLLQSLRFNAPDAPVAAVNASTPPTATTSTPTPRRVTRPATGTPTTGSGSGGGSGGSGGSGGGAWN